MPALKITVIETHWWLVPGDCEDRGNPLQEGEDIYVLT